MVMELLSLEWYLVHRERRGCPIRSIDSVNRQREEQRG